MADVCACTLCVCVLDCSCASLSVVLSGFQLSHWCPAALPKGDGLLTPYRGTGDSDTPIMAFNVPGQQ